MRGPRTLFVIIGAGASFDCASSECVSRHELRPPLVTHLFAPRFADILNNYPMAQMAASVIRSHLGDSMALEQFLRDHLRDSAHPADRSKFHSIHYYLQELLFRCGSDFTHHPDNYDRLIDLTERLGRVVYVSLNYDTILDDRLAHYSAGRLRSLGDYCVPERHWSLVKPHGSVNWGLPVVGIRPNDPMGFAGNPPPDIKLSETDFRLLPPSLEGMRRLHDQHESRLLYPAISAPVGAPDAFTCPISHIDFLRDEIEQQEIRSTDPTASRRRHRRSRGPAA